MTVTVKTPPVSPIVPLGDLKRHLVADDFCDDDDLIEGYEVAAVGLLDGWGGILGRCLGQQTLISTAGSFGDIVSLPIGPVVSILSITYRDVDGAVQTLDSAEYRLDAGKKCIVPIGEWPETKNVSDAVSVEFVAGGEVPANIVQAIKLIVADWYEFRGSPTVDISSIPYGARALLSPSKRFTV